MDDTVRLRRAMVNVTRETLQGEIEVDDAWVGGTQAGLRGSRQRKGWKAALVRAVVEKRAAAAEVLAVMADRNLPWRELRIALGRISMSSSFATIDVAY